MTRLHLIHSPDPDRDLPDPGDEVEEDPTCYDCGRPVEDPRSKRCDRCYYGPVDEPPIDGLYGDEDEPDDAGEP